MSNQNIKDPIAPLFQASVPDYRESKPKNLFDNKDNKRFAILADKNLATPTQKSTRKYENNNEINYDEEYE